MLLAYKLSETNLFIKRRLAVKLQANFESLITHRNEFQQLNKSSHATFPLITVVQNQLVAAKVVLSNLG